MKCQKCEKPATFHITEIESGKHRELHFCEECARLYLAPQAASEPEPATSLAGALAQQLALGQTAEELSKIDQLTCPVCGISFLEFRNQGRLGCPHDYVSFEKELEPLIMSIHNETRHVGKKPARYAEGTEPLTDLIRLRRDMKEAVTAEDYELASRLRDQIRQIEEKSRKASP
ncbi:MAG: UvrB/UvrC motif-containing protein [Pirellulales bacterium]|nr:UvrB/UvrC motif-containing protein [Pirellulales bacterium]